MPQVVFQTTQVPGCVWVKSVLNMLTQQGNCRRSSPCPKTLKWSESSNPIRSDAEVSTTIRYIAKRNGSEKNSFSQRQNCPSSRLKLRFEICYLPRNAASTQVSMSIWINLRASRLKLSNGCIRRPSKIAPHPDGVHVSLQPCISISLRSG